MQYRSREWCKEQAVTQDEFPHTFIARFIELGKITGAATSIIATLTAVWMFGWGPIKDFVDAQAGIASEITRMWTEIEVLSTRVAAANGEDRIIREQAGQTYVPEPVYQGELVTFNMVAERTTLGQPCRLMRTVPIYVDETRIPQPGPAVSPNRQIGAEQTFLQPRYEMPDTLQPGRIAMHLILEYECPQTVSRSNGLPDAIIWTQVLDRTSVAVFRLREGTRP
jgi:hypothetical protein